MQTHKILNKKAIDYLSALKDKRKQQIIKFHELHEEKMKVAKGSSSNHQTWKGGYLDHIAECFRIAETLYDSLNTIRKLPFSFNSVIIVLYFHDLEKIWKYTENKEIDKSIWYSTILPQNDINFTKTELNALNYIHGEHDYSKTTRKMKELASFCHACDVLSARLWHDQGKALG